MKRQTPGGVWLSVTNSVLNIVTGLMLVPLLLSVLSEETYSLYKVIQSFAGALMMFNIGLANVAGRAIALPETDDVREKENILALTTLAALAMGVLVVLVGQGMRALVPTLFGNTFTPEQLTVAKRLVTIFSIATALHILSDCFRGRILGKERYYTSQSTMTLFYVLRFSSLVAVARNTADICTLAMVDVALYGLMTVIHFVLGRYVLKEKGRLTSVSKESLAPIATYASAILLQALVTQATTNVDAVILGAVNASPRVITIYASALTIFTVYQSLTGTLANLYLAKAAMLTSRKSSGNTLTDFVIGPGKLQAGIALGVLAGFALLGRDFIRLWIGPDYLDIWPLALALMAAAVIPLSQTSCVTLLDSMLDRLPRSLVLLVMAVVNVALSVLLVKPLGYWGPALGTVVSLLLGDGLMMSLYYKKRLGLELGRMFREIYSGLLLAAGASSLVCVPLALFQAGSFSGLVVKGLLFLAAYAYAIYLFVWPRKDSCHGTQ